MRIVLFSAVRSETCLFLCYASYLTFVFVFSTVTFNTSLKASLFLLFAYLFILSNNIGNCTLSKTSLEFLDFCYTCDVCVCVNYFSISGIKHNVISHFRTVCLNH